MSFQKGILRLILNAVVICSILTLPILGDELSVPSSSSCICTGTPTTMSNTVASFVAGTTSIAIGSSTVSLLPMTSVTATPANPLVYDSSSSITQTSTSSNLSPLITPNPSLSSGDLASSSSYESSTLVPVSSTSILASTSTIFSGTSYGSMLSSSTVSSSSAAVQSSSQISASPASVAVVKPVCDSNINKFMSRNDVNTSITYFCFEATWQKVQDHDTQSTVRTYNANPHYNVTLPMEWPSGLDLTNQFQDCVGNMTRIMDGKISVAPTRIVEGLLI